MKSFCLCFLFVTSVFINVNADEFWNAKCLFRPEFAPSYDHNPNLNETYQVIQFLRERALSGIDFWEGELATYFDNMGLGSAMALDFLARYLNECSHLTEEEITHSVKGFEPIYNIQRPTFLARDYAYEHVALSEGGGEDPEIVKYRKLQSIANYHNIVLEPATESCKKKGIKTGKVKLKKLIEKLPPSAYVIRALDPASADEPEYGHTMILIKNENSSIFYESNAGAIQIDQRSHNQLIKLGEYIEDFLIELPFSEFRIYKASCGEGGCIYNLLQV